MIKKIVITTIISLFSSFFLIAGVSFAQTAPSGSIAMVPSPSSLASAVAIIGQIEKARQEVIAEVSAEIGNIALQLQGLPMTPLTTTNEQEATAFQLGQLAEQVANLGEVVSSTISIQQAETSLLTSIQAGLAGSQSQ